MSKSSLQQRAKVKIQRPGLSNEEIEEIKNAFDKYDLQKTGKIKPKQFLKEMSSMGFNIKAPYIYKLISELDTEEAEKNGGVPIDEIFKAINNKLGNTESEEGIKQIFELFKENPDDNTLSLDSLKAIASSFGISITDEEIKNMLEKASESGEGLTFEEFCKLMIKQK